MREQIGSFEYSAALQRIWRDVVDPANRYITETEPFKLAKTDLAACHAVLVNLAEWLRVAAIVIKPFLPRTAETFYRAFNFEESQAVGPGPLCRPDSDPFRPRALSRDGPDHRRQAGAAVSQDRDALTARPRPLQPTSLMKRQHIPVPHRDPHATDSNL